MYVITYEGSNLDADIATLFKYDGHQCWTEFFFLTPLCYGMINIECNM